MTIETELKLIFAKNINYNDTFNDRVRQSFTELPNRKITVEIKSLNSKQLDLSTRIRLYIVRKKWKYDQKSPKD